MTGLLLIGGRNLRMKGKKKYLLTYQEHTFLQLGIQVLNLFGPVYLSVASCNKTNPVGLPTIEDEYKGIGPTGGIYSSLKKLKQPLLVLPCDMPCINFETLTLLVNQYNTTTNSCFFSIEGRIRGLPGVYTPDFIPIFAKQINENNYRLMDAIKQAPHDLVNFKDDIVLTNINNFKDYMELQQ